MKVKKLEDRLVLALEQDDEVHDFISFVCSNELEMNDLTVYVSHEDGWTYLYDAYEDAVYHMNDYGFNAIETLIDEGSVELPKHPNDPELYAGYEWNEGVQNG